MMESHVFPTDNETPIQRFRSAAAPVTTHVLTAHKRAEVRLHAVQQSTVGGFHIRVFLNTPEATVDTPTLGNDHYVGLLNMFTGFCIGGPGHCAVPPKTHRKFDKRKRPHKTPGNFRIDATDTVKQLTARGESDLQVNLVVLNIDGSPATDALRLDAVSLSFMD
jgi:tyrosinase